MYLLYLDEFGHDGMWDPAQPNHRHHPLFGLAGIAVPGNRARDLDRGYLRLKERFYAFEIGEAVKQGKRRERYEPKQLSSRRDFIFSMEVVNLVRRLDGHVFAQGVSKVVGKQTRHWLYNTVAGRMLVAFERYLRSRGGFRDGCGVIVLDRRDELRDVKLLGSVQSFLFSSSPTMPGFSRISETPLLVNSEWYHGVQAADTIARAAGAVFRKRYFNQGKGGARLEKLGELLDNAAHTWTGGASVRVTKPHAASASRRKAPRERSSPLSQPVLSAGKAAELRDLVAPSSTPKPTLVAPVERPPRDDDSAPS